jgi:predicted NBD/HSP70 family sugar kinase
MGKDMLVLTKPNGDEALEAAAQTAAMHFKPRGSNQTGLRQFNERVVLHAIRLHGPQPKAELARLTKLSSQTVSLIIDRLLRDDLVVRMDPIRGKVGQPSVPIALNPDGAFSVGIKIGRRSCDALLLDFNGHVRSRTSLPYDYPDPDKVFAFIAQQLQSVPVQLDNLAHRWYGIGIAAPLSLDGWKTLLGISPERAARWQGVGIAASVQAMTELPVQMVKDTAAACVAELVVGRGRNTQSFLYVYVDTFIGGGLVIDNHLHSGRTGNAGAIASMPMQVTQVEPSIANCAAPAQLLSVASLYQLENLYTRKGLDSFACYDERALQAPWNEHTQLWLTLAAPAIAFAIHNAACLLDIGAVILDGSLDRAMLAELSSATRTALNAYAWEGVALPTLLEGTLGADARALGGGLLPLYSQFAPDQAIFLKLDS